MGMSTRIFMDGKEQKFESGFCCCGERLISLLDSGADVSAISEHWVRSHPELKRRPSRHVLHGLLREECRYPEVVDIPLTTRRQGRVSWIECVILPRFTKPHLIISDQARRKLDVPWPPDEASESNSRSGGNTTVWL